MTIHVLLDMAFLRDYCETFCLKLNCLGGTVANIGYNCWTGAKSGDQINQILYGKVK
jgi:hypothetical protein